jgi:predicted TIM-barrel fold metal-dependent hydrolase
MVLFANVNFRGGVGPGFGAKAARQLEEDIKAGAKGLKVFKDLGMFDQKADGSRLPVDDPELDPIWETCARLNVPVLIHIAEPAAFFDPLDYKNERWLELSLFPDRRHQTGVRFEQLMTERNNMVGKHRHTRFILAHFGWHANDLARAGKLLDENPNVYFDVAAVLYDFGRQPRAAHEFFVKYQDRILFGKDTYAPDEYPYYWRVFETADEYFDYYRDYHAFWKLYGMNLPDAVLKKLYFANALKVTPGLSRTGFEN